MDATRNQLALDFAPCIILLLNPDGTIRQCNAATESILQYHPSEILNTAFLNLVVGNDRDMTAAAIVDQNAAGGERKPFDNQCARKDGLHVPMHWVLKRDPDEGILYCFGYDQTDQSERKETIAAMEKLAELEKNILELNLQAGIPMREVADTLLLGVEKLFPGSACSILTLNQEQKLCHYSSPSLPIGYSSQIDGASPGVKAGSCGTAVYHDKTVIVSNIDEDPLWEDYRGIAAPFGLKACWSVPIHHSKGKILGSFAVYHYCQKTPSTYMLQTIERLSSLIGILMENSSMIEDLRLSNERYQLVAQATHDMVWDWDLTTDTTTRNAEGLTNVYGFSSNDPIRQISDWLERIHPQDRKQLKRAIDSIHNGNTQSIFECEYRFLRADKNYVHVYDRGYILRNAAGVAVRVIGAVQDITERARASEQLRESEERYRHLFNGNPLPMWIYDAATYQFLEVNERALTDYQYSAAEFDDMTIFDIRSTFENEQARIRQMKVYDKNDPNNHFKGIWEHKKKNGEPMTMEIYCHDIKYKERDAVLVLAHDITKNILLQKLQMKEKIERQEQIIKVNIGVQERERMEIGHELHENVNQILSTAKLYLECLGSFDNKKEEYRQMSFDLVNKSMEEIQRLSMSIVPPMLHDISLIQSIDDILFNMNVMMPLDIEFNHESLNEKKIDKNLMLAIYRIVQEQAMNIVKHAEASSVKVRLSHQPDGMLLLRIADNGKGFDPNADRQGIGLSNILNRAEVFRGQAQIDSSPGNGCTISVLFEP